MSVKKVSSLHIYPIKSTAGISLPQTRVEELGLAFDRRFIVSDLEGQFITARTEPTLCLVKTELINQGLKLTAPNMPALTLSYDEFTNEYQQVTVWGDEVKGQLCSSPANTWFSHYLQRPCQLLFFGQNSQREKKPNTNKARKIAFADGYPLLLISQASLDNLNLRLNKGHQQSVTMDQFRPNIVVDNCLPFAEDGWLHIRIGEIEFKVSKPCERCIFTTVNPKNAEKHPKQQPLRTLKSFRQSHEGEVLFGQNLIPLNSGTINQGDKITIISRQAPPSLKTTIPSNNKTFKDLNMNQDNVGPTPMNKKLNILFEKWKKNYQVTPSQQANAQPKTLLEHGEDAGLILPYSCRAGMCGRCAAKLVSGEVEQLTSDGLTLQEKQEGYILCCSAIATSDVVIQHK